MRRLALTLLWGVLLSTWTLSAGAAVQGSWSATAAPLRVSLAGRIYRSAPLTAPGSQRIEDHVLVSVAWRYRISPATALDSWLCSGERCVALAGQRGRSQALAGMSASEVLTLRFALPAGEKQAVVVEAIQVLVDFAVVGTGGEPQPSTE